MRSVPQRLKSFQMTLSLFLVRVFGTIPGPIIVGALIDKAKRVCFSHFINLTPTRQIWSDYPSLRQKIGQYVTFRPVGVKSELINH